LTEESYKSFTKEVLSHWEQLSEEQTLGCFIDDQTCFSISVREAIYHQTKINSKESFHFS